MELNICLCNFVNDFLPDTGRMFVRAGFYTQKYIEPSICLYEIVKNRYMDMLPFYSKGQEIGVLYKVAIKSIDIAGIDAIQYLKNIMDDEIVRLNGCTSLKTEINSELINAALDNGKISIAYDLGFAGELATKYKILYGDLDEKEFRSSKIREKYILLKQILNGDSDAFKGINQASLLGTFWRDSFKYCMKGGNLELIKLYSTKIDMNNLKHCRVIFKYGTIESLSIFLPQMNNTLTKLTYNTLANREPSIIHHTISLCKEKFEEIIGAMIIAGRSDIYNYYLKGFSEWGYRLTTFIVMSGNVQLFEEKKAQEDYPLLCAVMSENVKMYETVLEHNKRFSPQKVTNSTGIWGVVKNGNINMIKRMQIKAIDFPRLILYAKQNYNLQILKILEEQYALIENS